jgi:predicted HAD superfamily hydrolase
MVEATIDSVLSQNYPNLQYVVIDEESTDGSFDIIQKYKSDSLKCHTIPKDNLDKALNEVFSTADSEIAGWITSCDVLFPNTLNKLAYLFSKYPEAQWIQGLASTSSSGSAVTRVEPWDGRLSLPRDRQSWGKAPSRYPQESTFWRRNLWATSGLALDTRFRLTSNLTLWRKFSQQSKLLKVMTLLGSHTPCATNRTLAEVHSHPLSSSQTIEGSGPLSELNLDRSKFDGFQEAEFDFTLFNEFCSAHNLAKTSINGSAIRETQLASMLKLAENNFITGPAWLGRLLAHEAGDALNSMHNTDWFPANLPKIRGLNLNAELEIEEKFRLLQESINPNLTRGQLNSVICAYESDLNRVRRCHIKSLWYAKLLLVANRDEEGKSFLLHSLKLRPTTEEALRTAAQFLGPVSFSQAFQAAKKTNPSITLPAGAVLSDTRSDRGGLSAKARALLKEVRLEEAYKQLLSGRYEILSVDFFDTLVGRFVKHPKDLFFLLAERLFGASLLSENCSIPAFAALRQEAETNARLALLFKSIEGECRLSEIYEHLGQFVKDPVKAMEVEVELEKTLCFLNPAVASLVDWFIEQGGRVVISSDMYLCSNSLHEILRANNFDPNRFEKTFVSSESRLSKNKGSLFDLISSECAVSPSQVFHIGDHLHSDVKMPRSKGVTAFHYSQADKTTEIIHEREDFVKRSEPAISLNSLRFIGYNLRSHIKPEENQAYQIGAHTIGPALTLYADWVVRECRSRGISHVLCLMREGSLLSTMVQRAAAHLKYPLTASRLYASRAALRLASLGRPTVMAVLERTSKRGGASLSDLFKIFEIPDHMMALFPKEDPSAPTNPLAFASMICGNREFVSLIEKVSAARRKTALSYLHRVLNGSKRVGLIDLGFRGTIQHFLMQILRLEQNKIDVHGLYFACGPEISSRMIHGYKIDAFLNGILPEFSNLGAFTSHPEILEQTVSSVFEGTTSSYEVREDGSSHPVLERVTSSAADISTRLSVQRGILDFQRLRNKVCQANPRLQTAFEHTDPATFKIDAFKMILRLVTMPTTSEAEVLGNLVHDDNNGFDSAGKICPEAARKAFKAGELQEFIKCGAYWPSGVIGVEDQTYFNKPINVVNLLYSRL